MLALERRNLILEKLQDEKRVVVSELSQMYGVSEETIRRDLDKLEKEGLAIKSYGGAVINEDVSIDLPFNVRKNQNVVGKQKMAEIVASLVHDGEHLLLDASTTAKVALRSKAGVEPRFVSLFLSFAIEVISLLVEVELRHPDVENILKIMSMASFYDFDVRTLLFHKSGNSYITFYIVACRLVGNVLCIQYFRICFFQMGGKRGDKLTIEVDSLF